MTTSHLCGDKWKPGTVAECPKHNRLSKKQTSVYRTPDTGEAPTDTKGTASSPSSETDSA